MIQDIFPHRFDNTFRAGQSIGEKDYVLHFEGQALLLKSDGDNLEIPRKEDFPDISGEAEKIFLFTIDETPCFLLFDQLDTTRPGFTLRDISFFRTARQKEIAWISLVGLHLVNWYSQNRFCGKCGTALRHKTEERALICPSCNTSVFPKISPAIIVAIICKNKILLARNSNFPGRWYSLIAGYADIGESLEETLKREVKEEVGLDVTNIRYYKSQPWPLSGSMMIGFIAEADDNQSIMIDEREITEAAWFTRGCLPEHPSSAISIAGEMIEKFDSGEL